MRYSHLTPKERLIIALGFELNKPFSEIAKVIGRHRSTIFREHKRHATKKYGYCNGVAEMRYDENRRRCRKRFRIHGSLKLYIENRLKKQWSPEQIVGRRKLENRSRLSRETIYRFVYRERLQGGNLYLNLRRGRRKRRRRFPRYRWDAKRPSIASRPKVVNSRVRVGDFERDLVVGNRACKDAILTMVDRKSKLVRLEKLRNSSAREAHEATVRASNGLRVHSITNDNGHEFARFRDTASTLKAKIFFSRPYASWERGTVENTNGLLRQYFPKGTNFNEITNGNLRDVVRRLNKRPRKNLGFATPEEVHFGRSVALAK